LALVTEKECYRQALKRRYHPKKKTVGKTEGRKKDNRSEE
jgi:hypothetical protein